MHRQNSDIHFCVSVSECKADTSTHLTGSCGGLDVYVSILFCGSEGHSWAVSVVGGAGLLLTLSKVNGRSLGEQVIFS